MGGAGEVVMHEASGSAPAFYDALAPLFDVMTDWDARLAAEGPLLRHILDEAGAVRVLDAACGSGGHATALAGWGYQVAGADASPVMIEMARRKAAEAGQEITFAVAPLDALPEAFAGETIFDAVLCLGNSLPHLLSEQELLDGLRGMAGVLRPGGVLLLQNLNYDLRWVVKPRFFAAQGAPVEEGEALVWRFADYDEPAGRINFSIALFRKSGESRDWAVEVHTTPQRPVFRAQLVSALADSGFAESAAYGRMALPVEPFDPLSSPDCVIVARKD